VISDCLEFSFIMCKQRGPWRPRLQNLIQLNAPLAVKEQTREAFKHMVLKGDKSIESAIHSLAKLMGVGPATASGDLTLIVVTL
jgi:endonuclease III